MIELKTGMFGRMTDGDLFVIVGDTIVYQNGLHDNAKFNYVNYEIDVLYEDLFCFNQLRDVLAGRRFGKCVYKRNECTEMTVSEIEKKLGIKNQKIVKEYK